MLKPIISSDSHITEPPNTYVDHIDKKYRDTAPHIVRDDKKGDLFIVAGLTQPIPMGLVAAAGKKAEELQTFGAKFEELHRGGWAPHYMYRMDHAYDRHRYWLTASTLSKLPSEYFREHIYLTFQDDWVAFKMKDLCNPRRLLWANDFPHSDSTWPDSQAVLAKHTGHLTEEEKNWILHDNVAKLYQLAI